MQNFYALFASLIGWVALLLQGLNFVISLTGKNSFPFDVMAKIRHSLGMFETRIRFILENVKTFQNIFTLCLIHAGLLLPPFFFFEFSIIGFDSGARIYRFHIFLWVVMYDGNERRKKNICTMLRGHKMEEFIQSRICRMKVNIQKDQSFNKTRFYVSFSMFGLFVPKKIFFICGRERSKKGEKKEKKNNKFT